MRPDVPIERPDPAIYSQKRALASGAAPTWNSPDILTNWTSPWKLMPETKVTVHNLSPSVFAANVQVSVGFSAFGIGMPVTALSSIYASLAPSSSAQLLFPLTQAMLAGDQLLSVFVRIIHGSDIDTTNNDGEQAITNGRTSEVGRVIEFDIPVRNPANAQQFMTFVTFANTLGFVVSPSSYAFAPLQQIMVRGRITVAPDIHPNPDPVQLEATMAALGSGGAVVGGITYLVQVDD